MNQQNTGLRIHRPKSKMTATKALALLAGAMAAVAPQAANAPTAPVWNQRKARKAARRINSKSVKKRWK